MPQVNPKNVRPTILVTEPEYFTRASLSTMRRVGNVKAKRMNRAGLLRAVSTAHALVIRAETRVDKEILDRAPRLRCVASATTGIDHIDTRTLKEKGIALFSLAGAHSVSTAEHALALLLASARNIPQAHIAMREGKWQRWSYIGTELTGKTLGLFGVGHIGIELTRLVKGLRLKVLAYDPFLSAKMIAERGARKVSWNVLLKKSDFISLHAPLTQGTKGFFGHKAFAAMKPSAILINTARGSLIQEKVLLGALGKKTIRAAALDVYMQEPLPVKHPLRTYARSHNNLILTPHLGATTSEAIERASIETAQFIFKFFGSSRQNLTN